MGAGTEVVEAGADTLSAPCTGEVTPMTLLQDAVAKGLSAPQLQQLTNLYEAWRPHAIAEAYQRALIDFRLVARPIVKDTLIDRSGSGKLPGVKYAPLHKIDTEITPILCEHGFTASWSRLDQSKDWVTIRCTLTHVLGHKEHFDLGGPPDDSPELTPLQAIQSTITSLERYTLMGVCGLSTRGQDEGGEDGDPVTPAKLVRDALSPLLKQSANDPTAHVIWKVGNAALKALGETVVVDAFRDEAVAVRTALRERAAQATNGGSA